MEVVGTTRSINKIKHDFKEDNSDKHFSALSQNNEKMPCFKFEAAFCKIVELSPIKGLAEEHRLDLTHQF